MAKENSGMDEGMAQEDRGGWRITPADTTGGAQKDLESEAGIEVGNPYDKDPMGEKKSS